MNWRKAGALFVSISCFLSILLWLYYWLFVASLDSGVRPNVTIVNHPDGSQSFPVTYTYHSELRYRPYIPVVIAGVFGALVSSAVAGLVPFLLRRRPAHLNQLLVDVPISGGLGVLSAVALSFTIGFVWFAFFYHGPSASQSSTPVVRGLVMVLLLPSLSIYSGIPAVLGSVGTSCLIFGLRRNPRPCVRCSDAPT
jgi:hypothetical protein